MTDFQNQHQAVSSVIEFYRGKEYSEPVLTALRELLNKYLKGDERDEELAACLDTRLQQNGVHYDSANVYLLMMNVYLNIQNIAEATQTLNRSSG
jgi:hypothetical protein